MAHIISLVNHKGGVGKTTSSLNLGRALLEKGKRILLVDIDPQANLSQSLGVENPENSIYEVLCEEMMPPIITLNTGLDLLPSELSLSTAENQLISEAITGYFKLSNSLNSIRQNYDFILIDCPPSLGVLTINALLASQYILIVVEPQYLAIKGLQTIIELFTKLNTSLERNLQLLGLLLTQFNRTVVSKNIIEQLRHKYPEASFDTIIRQSVKITEASAMKQDIFSYDPDSNPAKDYLAVSEEILERLNA